MNPPDRGRRGAVSVSARRPAGSSLVRRNADHRRVRIVLWHGYLLAGTGSNIYTRAVARAWGADGHEVVVLCQEPHPERFDLGGARVVRPDIGGVLPVFVLDRYEGLEARYLQDFSDAEWAAYVEANAAAVRAELPADLVFANHVLPAAPWRQRPARRSRSRRTGPSSSSRSAAAPSSLSAVGKRWPRRRPCSSAPITFAACSRTCSATSTTWTWCPRASTWTSSGRSHETRRSRTCSPRPGAIRRTRATPPSACRTRATRIDSRSSSRRTSPRWSISESSCPPRASTCSWRRWARSGREL